MPSGTQEGSAERQARSSTHESDDARNRSFSIPDFREGSNRVWIQKYRKQRAMMMPNMMPGMMPVPNIFSNLEEFLATFSQLQSDNIGENGTSDGANQPDDEPNGHDESHDQISCGTHTIRRNLQPRLFNRKAQELQI